MQTLPPLSLYIHVPWCVKKCPYCDFNSHALPSDAPFNAYVNALIADARAQVVLAQGRTIQSIFIGGGTPSLLPIAEYERLFTALHALYHLAPDCEITLEANPATVEHAPFAHYVALGINRLSLGVQSFDEPALKLLGRIHHREHAIHAITAAKQAGFARLNVDLMHGLPNQTVETALADIQMAQQLGASHISWYQLTIEPNTAFYRKPPTLPDDEVLATIEMAGAQALLQAQFNNYEVSAWTALTDTPCRHNVNYWQFGDYLAIGAGAHGKVTLASAFVGDRDMPNWQAGGIYRFSKSRTPKDYLNYDSLSNSYPKFVAVSKLGADELVLEYMLNALRLRAGTTLANFVQTTALDPDVLTPTWQRLQEQGLMVRSSTQLAPTAKGFRFLNTLVQAFMP